ncbi:thiamine phosphate synthase [Marininema halotolerans]|uniref:Thiamine-phosphate pyrophosphorylase/thiazole tautomerase (Transcriptional regulator TenI) n=1 Tax=Marininema halotolerans TaxID=1155944 RepID=A0A1I6SX73_9BACL|nr:thiamine phosphate synthase [Marininema halotolerans]SFS81565.1 thiamine-phosphate pyrophosphorylase/thiazole tautomerase (transcriptional regulator TenI) [Marininema halotolerans]
MDPFVSKRTGIPLDAGFLMPPPQLHLIVSPKMESVEWISVVKAALPWLTIVHLRYKGQPDEKVLQWGKRLLAEGVPKKKLVINGSPQVAMTLGVGIHLPEDGPSPEQVRGRYGHLPMVGCSIHSVTAARKKVQAGADYLYFGHVFKTDSKPGKAPRGTETLQCVCESVNVPVIAIGGITEHNIGFVTSSGCAGVAVISTIAKANSPDIVTRRLRYFLNLNLERRDRQ